MNTANDSLRSVDAEAAIPRSCGAIALIDVMKQWGIEAGLRATWQRVALDDPFGTQSAKSYRLAAYAIDHGLQAIVLKCRKNRAWDALSRCARLGISVIINHQARAARDEEHFSVLLAISNETIITDDPVSRMQEVWSREDFLSHWTYNAEITGQILVAIRGSAKKAVNAVSNRCPSCSAPLSFEPCELFDPKDWESGGLWRYFYCQGCDASFSPRH